MLLKDINYKIIIPARKNSKGFRFKNRKLLDNTLSIIPKDILDKVIITTDDEEIMKRASKTKILYHKRSSKNSSDTASTKSAMEECVRDMNIKGDELVIMLYLTYPARTWDDVLRAIKSMIELNQNSLLCKQPVKSHPYLCMYEQENNKGEQIIAHNLYRRQDYPKCFEISHYVCAFYTRELKKLNQNMYNKDTYFYNIDRVIDIDFEKDLEGLK